MADIGRLDFAKGIKRALDLTGTYQPTIGEGVVPTIQVADLSTTPFSLSVPWSGRAIIAAFVAEYSWAVCEVGTPLPANSWIEVNTVIFNGAAGIEVWIEPMARADVPTPLTGDATAVAVSNRQGGPSGTAKRFLPEIVIRSGTDAVVGANRGIYVRSTSNESMIVRGKWEFGVDGCLAVISQLVNLALNVSFIGNLHYSASR